MPKTRFKPLIDGIAFPYSLSFTDKELDIITKSFQQAFDPALAYLKSDFGPLIKSFNLRSDFQQWCEETCKATIPYTGGLVFTILDYYYGRLTLPKGVLNPSYLSQESSLSISFREYAWSRAINYLSITAPQIMLWTAVRNRLPTNVFPEKTLTRQIESAVKKLGTCENTYIHYTYDTPKTGGYHWAYQQTLSQWMSIKANLDNGNPCAVTLINHTTRINSHHCVLAYDYHEISNSQITIDVFNTLDPTKPHHISIDFSQEKVGILTTFDSKSKEAITGILSVKYSPQKPALPLLKRILRYTLYPQISWHIHHLFDSKSVDSQ